ncbi:MAG TPA: hypothetical protein VIB47_07390, partial [Dehalococcoidia bacterium]
EVIEVVQQPYYDCRWPFHSQLGITTTAMYNAPPGVTAAEIVDFYVAELREDWAGGREDLDVIGLGGPGEPGQSQGSIPMARLVRNTATIHISTENMTALPGLPSRPAPSHDFTVSIDAEGTVNRPYCD